MVSYQIVDDLKQDANLGWFFKLAVINRVYNLNLFSSFPLICRVFSVLVPKILKSIDTFNNLTQVNTFILKSILTELHAIY